MHQQAQPSLFELAKRNRIKLTNAESILWERVRNKKLGVKFRRQHPLGNYIVDFYSHEIKLVVEVDGINHNEKDQQIFDLDRTRDILCSGVSEIRFTNNQVETNIENVILEIRKIIEELKKE